MKLTFKKAFGIETIPPDTCAWFLELGDARYGFLVEDGAVEISTGTFGNSQREAFIVDQFIPPGRRPLGYPIRTLDVAIEITDELVNSSMERVAEYGVLDDAVEKHIPAAFRAASVFVETYRDRKYLEHRGTERWKRKQLVLPKLTESEFRTFLFYTLSHESGQMFLGSFSVGEMTILQPFDDRFSASLRKGLQMKIPRQRRFLQAAWEQFFDEDFSGAIIYAAVSVESGMTRILRKALVSRNAGTDSQIGKVLEDTSNRLLCTVVLGVLGIGDPALRQNLVRLFDMRNKLAHGLRVGTKRDEGLSAIETAEAFFEVANEHSPQSPGGHDSGKTH